MTAIDSLVLKYSEGRLKILDQQLLPQQEKWLDIHSVADMIAAIKELKVRGAPLIGLAAALALAQSAQKGAAPEQLLQEAQQLYEARPTAVNLMICVERIRQVISEQYSAEKVLKLALDIFREDFELCEKIAQAGADLINHGDSILTHCNTGSLATAGVGTALGIIRRAHEQGKKIHVYVDETRPLLQGARLTAWELGQLGIPYTLITDNMAAHLMSLGRVQKVFVGSDRIAANGDFANKIGTYSVAVSCAYHKIPFYVAAPYTTVDPHCLSGQHIPIEERKSEEVRGALGSFGQVEWAPSQAKVYNPAFDITPADLVTAWILDQGVITPQNVRDGIFKKIKM